MRVRLHVLIGALALAGCSTPMAQLRKDLGPRASAQLECQEDALTYEELDRMISSTKVKVTGCKRTAVFEMVESRWKLTRDDTKGVLAR
jgi:hypothetical protein